MICYSPARLNNSFAKSSIAGANEFKPYTHMAYHIEAQATPYEHPARTCVNVWCPSHIRELIATVATGKVRIGGNVRVNGESGRD